MDSIDLLASARSMMQVASSAAAILMMAAHSSVPSLISGCIQIAGDYRDNFGDAVRKLHCSNLFNALPVTSFVQ